MSKKKTPKFLADPQGDLKDQIKSLSTEIQNEPPSNYKSAIAKGIASFNKDMRDRGDQFSFEDVDEFKERVRYLNGLLYGLRNQKPEEE